MSELQRFRVCAKDAHTDGALVYFSHPALNEEKLRAALLEHATHLELVRVDPLNRGLHRELQEAYSKARILPEISSLAVRHECDYTAEKVRVAEGWGRRDIIETRLKDCCALAELLGHEAQENLIGVLRRFDKTSGNNFALTGIDSCPFSFSFRWGVGCTLHGGVIFHLSSKTWGTHT